jgi:Leucine-rich repeat (LRR) protein
MKNTVKFISLLLIFSVLFVRVKAETPEKNDPKTDYISVLNNQIKSSITYPDFAKDSKLQGFVLVSFKYTNEGKLVVIDANSNNALLRDYVITELNKLDLCDHAKKPEKVYNMRFDFKRI